ncbi:MAG TPA: branched-chain amino acid ABC transporter permease, partial [Kiloniellaceae bacterium]|nr:branched-chain amino acid ABC transporter permease [Kiloniellaceae bacterium]
MMERHRKSLLFAGMALLLLAVGLFQSWSLALAIVNMCIVSAIMSLGVNMQWGYAGLFNAGVMGFAALGGVATVLVAMPPIRKTWEAGGGGVLATFGIVAVTAIVCALIYRRLRRRPPLATAATLLAAVIGYFIARAFFLPAVEAIEAIEPARTGYLGGLGLPVLLAWPVGGLLAAGAAWVVGKIALGLRSDYLAIATLGISEIIVAVLKNEDW